MSELLPAAQTVWNAYEELLENECVVTKTDMKALTAALRAAADQVAPRDEYPSGIWTDKDEVRYQLLAIADELKTFAQ